MNSSVRFLCSYKIFFDTQYNFLFYGFIGLLGPFHFKTKISSFTIQSKNSPVRSSSEPFHVLFYNIFHRISGLPNGLFPIGLCSISACISEFWFLQTCPARRLHYTQYNSMIQVSILDCDLFCTKLIHYNIHQMLFKILTGIKFSRQLDPKSFRTVRTYLNTLKKINYTRLTTLVIVW